MKRLVDKIVVFALVAPALVALVLHGSTKPQPVPSATILWDAGLADSGSVATNDLVFLRATYDLLLANDSLHVDYRTRGSTNALDWVRAYNGFVYDLAAGFTVNVPDATNRVIWVWSEYIPPAPVHTNGEYRITYVGAVTNAPPGTPRYVLPRTPIVTSDGLRLAPPELAPPPRASLGAANEENQQ